MVYWACPLAMRNRLAEKENCNTAMTAARGSDALFGAQEMLREKLRLRALSPRSTKWVVRGNNGGKKPWRIENEN